MELTIKFVALVCFYQDGVAGQRLLKNLTDLEIPSIWADGRINQFPAIDNSNLSTDGFREIIKATKNTTLIDVGLHYPGDQINSCLQEAADQKYDYTITLGCDEYLTGELDKTYEVLERLKPNKPQRYKIPIVEHHPEGNNNAKHVAERITFMPGFVRVENIHWLYYSFYQGEYRMLGLEHEDMRPYGIILNHDDTIRPNWRNSVMDQFQKQQVPRERKELEQLMRNRFNISAENWKKFGVKHQKLLKT